MDIEATSYSSGILIVTKPITVVSGSGTLGLIYIVNSSTVIENGTQITLIINSSSSILFSGGNIALTTTVLTNKLVNLTYYSSKWYLSV